MIRVLCAAVLLFALVAGAQSARAAELIMFDLKGCPWCAKWHAEIGAAGYARLPGADRAPLRVYLVGTPAPDDIKPLLPIAGTPTFVLVDNGVEIDRFSGYAGEGSFFGRLQLALDKLGGADRQYKTIIVQ